MSPVTLSPDRFFSPEPTTRDLSRVLYQQVANLLIISPHGHFFITSELTRLGVKFTSLAPRFIGRFEKGVDYIGDLAPVTQTDRRLGKAKPC